MADWEDSPWREEGAFDSLLLAHVIEHMDERPGVALRAYLPYLDRRPGVLHLPARARICQRPDPRSLHERRRLAALAEGAGLTVQRSYSFPFPRWTGKVFTYNEFCVVARKPDGNQVISRYSTRLRGELAQTSSQSSGDVTSVSYHSVIHS